MQTEAAPKVVSQSAQVSHCMGSTTFDLSTTSYSHMPSGVTLASSHLDIWPSTSHGGATMTALPPWAAYCVHQRYLKMQGAATMACASSTNRRVSDSKARVLVRASD